jgi:uncharacterized protein YyaL (SSP411 family)
MSFSPRHTNRLAREKSPYLLQHAHNPVDWFAWGDEAFAMARNENKPIFLSIGYSTCHWCHVMERESFETEAAAAALNRDFVSIKVDREERPDVDKIYMTFVQATTGAGGWPMSVFLTPDLKPFYGGTYFPPEPRQGRPGFIQLVERIAELWRERRADLELNAEQVHAQLAEAMQSAGNSQREEAPSENRGANDRLERTDVRCYGEDWLRAAGAVFKEMYDPRNGGFGRAPKFPQPGQPQFLLRYADRFGDDAAKRMVLHTCERMAAGGIHDQLGGGFARYSVDAEWLVPHFEKMLYDNAQLVQLYLDAHLVSLHASRITHHETEFSAVARGILDYILRDMTHPDGGFYSAEDADSEGHEGKFYCWTHDELSKLLTVEEFNVTVRHFGITKQGNFVDHSHPSPLPGQNVLSVVEPFEVGSPAFRRPEPAKAGTPNQHDDASLLASAKAKMIATRAKRIRPHLDDKVLASWNGLMLGAFARASAVLGDEAYRTAAEKNLKFIQDKLWVPRKPTPSPSKEGSKTAETTSDAQAGFPSSEGSGVGSVGTLYHRWREGERDSVQLLDAYAFLLGGVVELYEATLEPAHLDFAIELADAMLARFHDAVNGGFWQSAADSKDLILRVKDDTDGAEPSGNSVATLTLLRLAAITGREDFREAAAKTLRAASARLERFPQAVPCLLQALDFWLAGSSRVVVAGDPAGADTRRLVRAAHSVFVPNTVVLGNCGAVEAFARTLPAKGGPVAYACSGQTCKSPTSDAEELRRMLAG